MNVFVCCCVSLCVGSAHSRYAGAVESTCPISCCSHVFFFSVCSFLHNFTEYANRSMRHQEAADRAGGGGISSGMGLHWLKILIDLLTGLSVSSQIPGSGVTDRDGCGGVVRWPAANQEEPLRRMGWEDEGRLRKG